jgi:hypothetical protein
MSITATDFADTAAESADERSERPPVQDLATQILWRGGQNIVLVAGIFLVGLLLFSPPIGLAVMWNVLIPTAPALIVVAPGLWRNVCPMATFSLLPRRWGLSHERSPSRWMGGALGIASVLMLALIVPLRHLSLNTDGPLTALMLVVAAGIAFTMGLNFGWRSGWCNSLCPIHPVEKLFGFAPAISVKNARCDSCGKCTTPCPDSTRSMTPIVTGPSLLDRRIGHGLTGSFVGFVWGWYQVPDYSGAVGISEVMVSYLLPLGCASLSLALYAAGRKWLCPSQAARAMLVKVFATAAVCTYYWYRIPALCGFGPHRSTGLLYDLTGVVPDYFPLIAHTLTTLFFAWFLLVRRNPKMGWMTRPLIRSNTGQGQVGVPGDH